MTAKKNSNLHAAKKAKNDEFYTQISDIEKELKHYKDHFRNKVVFLNCDDPESSHFWKFFELNFEHYGLKKLVATHFDASKQTYKLELTGDINGDGRVTCLDIVRTELSQNGDFRSPESLEILQESDIVVTNPPFSLFREFIEIMMDYDKKFLVVGNKNAITYKEVFKHIQSNKIWLGVNLINNFRLPDNAEVYSKIEDGKKIGTAPTLWYTNLEHKKRNEDVILFQKYSVDKYPTYDNYNAIEVPKVKNIPEDYFGEIGVPITFLTQYNPDQFEIVRFRKGDDGKDLRFLTEEGLMKEPYFRIIIKRKQK